MKFIKKNQVVIYATALMLIVAGYLNFTTGVEKKTQTASADAVNIENKVSTEKQNNIINSADKKTNSIINSVNEEKIGSTDSNIGDAQLVSANAVNENNISENNIINTENNKNEIKETSASANSKKDNEYFSKSKLDRDTMYSQMLETYENILNSGNSTETQKQSATEEIKKINNTKNSIMICENLIETKGFESSVIFVNDKSINVVVKDSDLTTQKVAQIQNIISREMSAKVENIHISSK